MDSPLVTSIDISIQDGMPWMKAFLIALCNTPVVGHACDAAGISRQTAYRHRDENLEFASLWDAAIDAGWDRAEKEAVRRAVDGFENPVFHNGVEVGTKREYSDRLLEVLLKGNRAKTYRETHALEVTGRNGGAIQTEKVNGLSDAELDALIEKGIAAQLAISHSRDSGEGTQATQ